MATNCIQISVAVDITQIHIVTRWSAEAVVALRERTTTVVEPHLVRYIEAVGHKSVQVAVIIYVAPGATPSCSRHQVRRRPRRMMNLPSFNQTAFAPSLPTIASRSPS